MVIIEFDKGVYGFNPEDDDPRISSKLLLASGWTEELVELIDPYLPPAGQE